MVKCEGFVGCENSPAEDPEYDGHNIWLIYEMLEPLTCFYCSSGLVKFYGEQIFWR